MELKIKRTAPPAAPPSRPIMKFEGSEPGPHRNPPSGIAPAPSNETAAQVLRVVNNPPGIDRTQQRF